MLKISIVMLTTAMFAGLLIAEPYGTRSIGIARTGMDVARLQAVPAPADPQPPQGPVAGSVETPDNQLVAQDEPSPLRGPAPEHRVRVAAGAGADPELATAGAGADPEPPAAATSPVLAGDPAGTGRGAAREGYWAQATASGTIPTSRRFSRSGLHTARNSGGGHHGRHRA